MSNDPDEHIEPELEGYQRHEGSTLITYCNGDEYGVVRVSDQDAIDGLPATVVAKGAYAEVRTAVAALEIDGYAAAHEDRPDGESFIAAATVMYTLAQLGDHQFAVLELTDFDAIEGEYATIVHMSDDLTEAKRMYTAAVSNRLAGRPPISGRLGHMATCSNCGATVGASHIDPHH